MLEPRLASYHQRACAGRLCTQGGGRRLWKLGQDSPAWHRAAAGPGASNNSSLVMCRVGHCWVPVLALGGGWLCLQGLLGRQASTSCACHAHAWLGRRPWESLLWWGPGPSLSYNSRCFQAYLLSF